MTKTLLCAALLAALPLTALAQTPAPVIDNARVTVRDVALEPGKPAPVIEHAGDYIILTIGEPFGKAGGTNTMKIVKVGEHRRS